MILLLWDEITALKEREDSCYCFPNYSATTTTSSAISPSLCADGATTELLLPVLIDDEGPHASSSLRSNVGARIHSFVVHFNLPSTVESAATSYLDRYLASIPRRFRGNGRVVILALLTSLFLAIKMECTSTYLPVSDLLRMFQVQSVVSVYDILKMERHLLKTLQWKVNPPLPQQYVELLFQLLPTERFFGSSPCLKQSLQDRALARILKAYRDHHDSALVRFYPCYQVSVVAVSITLENVGMTHARDTILKIAEETTLMDEVVPSAGTVDSHGSSSTTTTTNGGAVRRPSLRESWKFLHQALVNQEEAQEGLSCTNFSVVCG